MSSLSSSLGMVRLDHSTAAAAPGGGWHGIAAVHAGGAAAVTADDGGWYGIAAAPAGRAAAADGG